VSGPSPVVPSGPAVPSGPSAAVPSPRSRAGGRRELAAVVLLAAGLVVPSACRPGAGQPAPEAAPEPRPEAAARPVATEPAGDLPAAELAAEVETWREERLAGLTADDGWLTLVGLHWLPEDETTIGSAEGSGVRLPASTPARVGTLAGGDGTVRLDLAPGVEATAGGEPFAGGELASDAGGEPTVVELGTVSFYAIERGEKVGLRVKDTASEAREDFAGIPSYPVDPRWRVAARFAPYDPPRDVEIPDVTGNVQKGHSPGAVLFEAGGETRRLEALDGGPGELFLIFADETSGEETYGAGRYLYVPAADETGRLVVDFNRAYNPPCAFTAYATCPLPPKANRLPFPVEAGEKLPAGIEVH